MILYFILAPIVVAGVLALAVGASILRGYAFSILWGWFIVPTFHLPAISVPLAIGIMITLGEITRQYVPAKEGDTWKPIIFAYLCPLFALLCGWIIMRYWL